MIDLIHILNFIILLLYIANYLLYVKLFINNSKNISESTRILLPTTLAFHASYLLFRMIEFKHPPITDKFEIFTLLSFALLLIYFVIEKTTKNKKTGIFILLFPLSFQFVSTVFIKDSYIVKEVLNNPLLGLHVSLAILGNSGFIISAAYGIMFVLLFRKIKLKNYGLVFKNIPSLDTLEKMTFRSLLIGYILFSLAILIGAAWLPIAFPEFNHLDPKLISSIIIWSIYSIGLIFKLKFKWYGKKVIYFSIIGFFITILSQIITFITTSFHSFN